MITPPEAGAEEVVVALVPWLKLAIEAMGALVIGLGFVLAARRSCAGRSRLGRRSSPACG